MSAFIASHLHPAHPLRFVQWSQLTDDPHTVSIVYENAERGYPMGFYAHVPDLSVLEVLRVPAQPV